MIRIILVSGLAIGTATGGAVALALAHDGLFARSGTPVDRKPLAAIALPEPAPMVASVTALTAATDMEWDSAAQDIYNTSQEAVSPIRPEDHQKPDKAGLVTLSTSGLGRTMPAEDAEDIDASLRNSTDPCHLTQSNRGGGSGRPDCQSHEAVCRFFAAEHGRLSLRLGRSRHKG